MRMKAIKKKLVALGLATAMALSVITVPYTGGYVQAAEADSAIWSSGSVSMTFAVGTDDTWKDKVFASNDAKLEDAARIENAEVGEKVKLTAKITLDGDVSNLDGAETEEGSEAYNALQLSAAIKSGDSWSYAKAGNYPFLKAEDFTEGVTEVEFTIDVKKADVGTLQEVIFQYNVNGYEGNIVVSDVSIVDGGEAPVTKEEDVWNGDDVSLTFAVGTDDTWKDKVFASNDAKLEDAARIENAEVGEKVKLTAKITLDGDVSNLDGAETEEGSEAYNALQLSAAIKSGDSWSYAKAGNYPFLKAEDFTEGVTEVEFTIDVKKADVGTLQEIVFQYNVNGYEGNIVVSNVKIVNVIETGADKPLEEKAPTVVADFAIGIDGWAGEPGWDYSHGKEEPATDAQGNKTESAEAAWDEDSQSLKMTVDYSKDTKSGWSEAKVKGTFEAVDISNYNLVSFTLRYPSDMETVKTKLFMKDTTGDVTVLDGEGSFRSKTVKNLGNGWSTVTIRGEFKPKDVKVDNLTIGIVGPYAALKNVYIDDVTIGQLDASEDYVEITEEVKENGDKADITKMAKSVKLVDAEATAATKALAAYLAGLQASDQVLFGHQNSSFRSVRDNGVTSDIKDITGSEAGLFGIDTLALAGNEVSKKTRQEALDASIAATKKAYNGGSIITLSCHMPNFTNSKIKATGDEKYPYDFTSCDFSESKDLTPCADYILEGGEYNPQFNAYLDIIADYALALQEDGIPVLFRPFHENSGGWFWWGTSTSVESYKAMWRYMVNYLQDKGVHNFLYVYSPNGPFTSTNVYLERWPGDAYVDVIGFDYYDDYANVDVYTGDNFFEALAASCQVVAGIAEEKGKIPAIAETGIRITGAGKDSLMVTGNPTTGHDWYNKVINTAVEKGIPYFLLWANFDSGNFFVPFKYNDTLGQEMINEFISSYNNEKSIFGNGTNFYTSGDNGAVDAAISKAGSVTLTGYSTEVTGYMIAPKDYAVIKEAYSLKASVKNAKKVSFEIRTAEDAEPLTIDAKKAESGNVYTADLTDVILAGIEQTSTGIVKLIADGQTLGQAKFINFNKEADVMPQYIIDNFEYYYGSDGLLQSKWGSANTAAGCSATIALSDTKVEGDYSGAFSYELAYKGSEVWAGGLGRVFDADKTDFSEYNAISMWVKPDGNGQKMVIQLNDNYEAYLTEFVKGTKAQYVTIPFSKFIKKGGTEAVDPSNLTSFKLWCNSVPDNYTGDKDDKGNYTVSGTILFDDIKAVEISEEDLEKVNENGLIISDEALKDLSNEKRADKKAAAKVTEAIEAIKDVKYDDASKKAIEDARKAYDALTDAQKKLVSADTLKKLEAAEKSYADQKKAAEDAAANATEADKKAAADVTAAIEAIKDVQYNDASKAAIEAARNAYDALTDAQKALISADTLKKLTDAEAAYAQKKAEAENPVKTPVLEATKNATNAITVKWTATEGAAGYNVYVAVKKTYVKVGSTSSTSYKINKVNKKKLKAATAYQVKVVAYDKDNKELAGSELELATATSPAKVKISSLSRKSSAKAALKWKKVTGASGYEVYMKTGSGKYKLVKTIKKGKTVSCTQSKLKKGKKYTFKVRAYKTAGGKKVYGAYSKTKSIQLR